MGFLPITSKRSAQHFGEYGERLILLAGWAFSRGSRLSLYLGLGCICAGFILRLWERAVLLQDASMTEPIGPYRFVQHPYLLGYGMVLAGINTVFCNPLLAGVSTILFFIYFNYARVYRDSRPHARWGAEYRYLTPQLIPSLLATPIAAEQPQRLYDWKYAVRCEAKSLALFGIAAIYLYVTAP